MNGEFLRQEEPKKVELTDYEKALFSGRLQVAQGVKAIIDKFGHLGTEITLKEVTAYIREPYNNRGADDADKSNYF